MSILAKFLDDREKSVNPAHAVALILVVASVVWVSYLVWHNKILPDLSGIAYLLGGSGAMNIANKMEGIVAKFQKQPDPVVNVDVQK